MRTLDNITVVVVAFDGFASLFEQNKTIENVPSHNLNLERKNPQFKSTDNMRTAKEYPQTSKLSFDAKNGDALVDRTHQFKYPKTSSFHDDLSTAGRTDSIEKNSDSNLERNRQSEDSRLSKTTFNEVQLRPIKRLNHSLKDANLENVTKTPVITKNSKMEGLTSINQFASHDHNSKSAKHKQGILMIKSNGSRNHSIFSPSEEKGQVDKNSETITDKFIRKSNDFIMKKYEGQAQNLSEHKPNKIDFATLSFNSRKMQKDNELKESVSLVYFINFS